MMEIKNSDLVILVLVLVIKQALNLVHVVVFYSAMAPLMKYVRGLFIVISMAIEIVFAFSLSLGISITAGLFLTIISFVEIVSSLSFIPFDYRREYVSSNPSSSGT